MSASKLYVVKETPGDGEEKVRTTAGWDVPHVTHMADRKIVAAWGKGGGKLGITCGQRCA
jgi:hypothetical protein